MDVSERASRENELRLARDAAESASRAKSDFLAAMSHELRTPLSAVIGYAELLKHQIAGPMTAQQMVHADRITSSAWHLIGIIDEVLTFSRAEAGREEVHIEGIDMCEAARTAMTRVEPQAHEKGLALSLECECDVMPIQSDALKVQQIIINLLGNAVKFTEQGGVTVRVTREADHMIVAVSDTGLGVPEAHREHIFEAFTQVDQSATRAKGGTGLGLPVSRKLAELLGGTLTLDSHTGPGSTFILRLPAARAADHPDSHDDTQIHRRETARG
jgi:signal transduction histidine kinase